MSRLRATALLATLLLTGCTTPEGEETTATATATGAPARQEIARTFPDGTEPDYATSVKVLAFDPGRDSAIVEPIVFMQGRDYCATFGVDPVDARCTREVVIEDSNTRITLALSDDLKLFTTAQSSGDVCLDDDGAGACPISEKAFAALVGAQGEEGGSTSARLVVKNGKATRLAELYQP